MFKNAFANLQKVGKSLMWAVTTGEIGRAHV